jgi:hypothetical protein
MGALSICTPIEYFVPACGYTTAWGVEFLVCARGLGSLATGEAFDPGPRDEFSIGFKQVGDVNEAEFCEGF